MARPHTPTSTPATTRGGLPPLPLPTTQLGSGPSNVDACRRGCHSCCCWTGRGGAGVGARDVGGGARGCCCGSSGPLIRGAACGVGWL